MSFFAEAVVGLLLGVGVGVLLLYLVVTGRDSRLVWGLITLHLTAVIVVVFIDLTRLLKGVL